MSLNLNQIPTAASSLLSTDKMYIARSPFGVTDDRYILGSSLITQFGTPLTTKGDIYTFTTVPARLAVGSNGQLLQASSGQPTGLAYTTATYPSTTTINQLLYSSSANTIVGLATANSSVLITSAGGVPSFSSTLPSAVQDNITRLGTIVSGVWNGTAITVANGGTGVSSFTAYMPICGGTTSTGTLQSVSTAGAVAGYALTYVSNAALPTWQAVGAPFTPSALTKTDDTNVTLTLGGTPSTALLQATSLTLGWSGTLSGTRGGTGVNNGTFTITTAGNLNFAAAFSTSGGFAVTQTYTGITNVTFPTSGTLATTSQLPTPAALTKTDDTNVTLTLGGTPATALLQATSLTLGWTGQLGLSRGGTNADLSAQVSNGGIVWSNATQLQIIGGTATAGQMLRSGSTATPTWSTATWPATTTANQLLYSSFNNTVAGLASANSSVLVTSSGGVPTLSTTLPSGLTIPGYAASGANGDITSMTGLTGYLAHPLGIKDANGNIIVNFQSSASAVNYLEIYNRQTGASPILNATGSDSSVSLLLQSKGGAFKLLDGTATNGASLAFANAANTHSTILQVAASQSTDVAFTLPATDGTAGQFIKTDASGNLAFSSTLPASAILQTPASGTLTNCTGLPYAGISAGASTSWSPTVTGFSGTPTTSGTYIIIGKIAYVTLTVTGTSNANTFTCTNLPAQYGQQIIATMMAVDNGADTIATSVSTGGSTTIGFAKGSTTNTATWTTSGTKGCKIYLVYETV